MSPDAAAQLRVRTGLRHPRVRALLPGNTGRPRPWGETSEVSEFDYSASCRVVRELHA